MTIHYYANESLRIRQMIGDPRAEKVKQYLLHWEKNKSPENQRAFTDLVQLALKSDSIDGFIDQAFRLKDASFNFVWTMNLIQMLYQKGLPDEIVDGLFSEILHLANGQIVNHPKMKINEIEEERIITLFEQLVNDDGKSPNVEVRPSDYKKWVIFLLSMSIVWPRQFQVKGVKLDQMIQQFCGELIAI